MNDQNDQLSDGQVAEAGVQREESTESKPSNGGSQTKSLNYTVKTYAEPDGKVRRVIEPDRPENLDQDPPPHPNTYGPEGDKNYWGADVWKKRK